MSVWQIIGAAMLLGPFAAIAAWWLFDWVRCSTSSQWKDLAVTFSVVAAFLGYVAIASLLASGDIP